MKVRDKVRRAILRNEPECRICARAGASVAAVTVTAILPIEQGGRAVRSNLQPVCVRHAVPAQRAPALARILRRRLKNNALERGIPSLVDRRIDGESSGQY